MYNQIPYYCRHCGKMLDPMLNQKDLEHHRSARCIKRSTEKKLQEERKRQPRLPGL